MILTQTPYRVSLFGGGTDYPSWFSEHGGCALGMAINKYCYVSMNRMPPLFDFKYRLIYQKVEDVNSVDAIEHPAIRGVLQHFKSDDRLEIRHAGDLPARTGLGASSSFVVGLSHALHEFNGDIPTASQLADEAIHIEQNVIKEAVGCQDQTFAAHGGLLFVTFNSVRTVERLSISKSRLEELEGSFVMVYTGIMRNAHLMAEKQIQAVANNSALLTEMSAIARRGRSVLMNEGERLSDIGYMLHETWMLKRQLCEGIANTEIDHLYQKGMDCGAIGGKLLGAGGGGFILFFVHPNKRVEFERRIESPCIEFKVSDTGSRLLLNKP